MKKIITSVALMLSAALSFGQTIATDFTAADCSSTTHTLFNQLDSGHVVVMVWVMPCGACVGPAKAAYNAVQSFATSHPGKVKLYIIDDYGDDNCPVLSNWITSSGIGNLSNITLFDNDLNVIDMGNYGTPGMPKVVVAGSANHTIFYNNNNSRADDLTGITNAITTALTPTAINDVAQKIQFELTPNPVKETLRISSPQSLSKLTVTTVNGQVVKEETFSTGKQNPVINLSDLAAGIYLIKVTDTELHTATKKFIKQ